MDLILRLSGTVFLSGLIGGAILVVSPSLEEVVSPRDSKEEQAIELSDPTTQSGTILERDDVYFEAILERPVFEVTRRPLKKLEAEPEPEVPPEAPEKPPEVELPQVSLLGVMSAGSRNRVLISVDGESPIWLNEGDRISGWTIAKTGKDWLDLTANKKTIRLELFE